MYIVFHRSSSPSIKPQIHCVYPQYTTSEVEPNTPNLTTRPLTARQFNMEEEIKCQCVGGIAFLLLGLGVFMLVPAIVLLAVSVNNE